MLWWIVLLLACGLIAEAPVRAEPRTAVELLTLERALEIAQLQNFPIQNATLNVEKAKDGVAIARTARLPVLDLSVSERRNLTSQDYEIEQGQLGEIPGVGPNPATPLPTTNAEIPTTSDFTTTLQASASLPLSQQYRIGLQIREMEIGQELAVEQLRAERQKVSDQVKEAYYAIMKTKSAIEANAETILFLEELNLLVDRYVQEQTALEYESLDVHTRLAAAEHQALTERNTLASRKEQLNELLGRSIETRFETVAIPDAPPAIFVSADAQRTALAQRPEMRAARLGVERAEYGYRVTKSKYIPNVSLVASYLVPFNIEFLPNNVASVGVYGEWEFYDWGRKSRELDSKRASIHQARNRVRHAEAQVRAQVNGQIRKLEEAMAQVEVAELSQLAALEKRRVKLAQYREQAALLQDVLEAQANLADANKSYQDAQLAIWTATANLERALGEE
ncbi:MAG: TolC family protein [Myxococcales bacterium]|nr:TolC family protein [Myxococcales bacterium]